MNKEELVYHKIKIELDLKEMERNYEELKTNHILHAILSILTGGIWLIVWFVAANSNGSKRAKLKVLIDESRAALAEISDQLNF